MEKRELAVYELAQYALRTKLIRSEEYTWAINTVLDVLRLDSVAPLTTDLPPKRPLCAILDDLLDDAFARGVLAENTVTHRDLLGAIMNLGITREQVGDIVLRDNTAYIFATEKIAPYIADNLTKAKHTQLTVITVDELPEGALFTLETRQCVVASERIDGVAAHVYKYSRSQINELFRAGKIFLNGKCCQNTNTVLKDGDTVSVRGEGRFIYRGAVRTTKSGNLSVEVDVYV